jgi:probable O-glycosylation ligase (exosortase A-associated)
MAKGRVRAVRWQVGFVAFLVYILAIVTYTLPVADVAMAVAIISLLFDLRSIRIPGFLLIFAGFLLWALLGYLGSSYPEQVGETLILGGKLWLIAFVAVNVLRTPSQLRVFLVFFILCFATYPARGAIFNYVGGYTMVGRAIWNYIYSNPNDLAALTFFPLAIAVALWTSEGRGWFKMGAMASLVVLPLLILSTQSRGAFIALALVGLFLLLRQRRRGKAIAAVAGLGILALFVVPEGAWERFSGLRALTSVETIAEADPERSAESRFNIWKVSAEMVTEHPLSGVGLGAFDDAYAVYARSRPDAPQGRKDAHSTYISVAASTGLPGLAIFVSLLALVLTRVNRSRRRLMADAPRAAGILWYLQMGLIAYLLAGIFGSFALLSFLYLHLAVLWAAAEIFTREQARFSKRKLLPNLSWVGEG